MKAKLNIDRRTIQEFFVEHAEKVIFAGIVVCFAVIVYGALGRETTVYRKLGWETCPAPDDLIASANQAEDSWKGTVLGDDECKAADYPAIAGLSRVPIEEEAYEFKIRFDEPIFEKRGPRGEPPVLAVKELRGTADCARVSMIVPVGELQDRVAVPPAVGASYVSRVAPQMGHANVIRGQRWVVLTGLVPFRQQVKAFDDYFSQAQRRNPETDFPQYVGYVVQRAEVSSPGATDTLNWGPEIYSGIARRDAGMKWSQRTYTSQEVVDPRFLDREERLSFPLPPVVGRLWDASVAHEPQIRLFSSQYEGTPEEGLVSPDGQEDDPWGLSAPGQMYKGASPRYRTPPPGYRRPSSSRYPMPSRPYAIRSPSYRRPSSAGSMLDDASQLPEYLLFRFFDLSAESGRHYVYRVSLVLSNPNYGVEDRYLDEQVLARKKRIEESAKKMRAEGKENEARAILRQWQVINGAWTDPGEVVSVPRDTRLLAVSVTPSPRVGGEPLGKVMVIKWVQQQGIEAWTERSVSRGKVVNFPDCRFPEEPRRKPKDTTEEETGYEPSVGRPSTYGRNVYRPNTYGQNGRQPNTHGQSMYQRDAYRRPEIGDTETDGSVEVDYVSDALVLDMGGGEVLPGKGRLTRPGTILLLHPDGTLATRSELDDLLAYTEFKQRSMAPEMPGEDVYRSLRYDSGFEGPSYDDFEGNLGGLRRGSGSDGPSKGRPRKYPRPRPGRDSD